MLNFSSVLTLLVLLFVSPNVSAIDKVFPGNAKDVDIIIKSSISDDDDTICKSLVQTQGYACEEHKVTTKDGYILSVQRIPVGRSGKTASKPPVLLQHGLLVDAAAWLLNTPDESLGFILADNGFDVWLANTRGTKYSRGHTSLSSNDSAYWEWSWDELVQYDLSALVQYVQYKTGQKLHYVGHSLGTLIALAAFSEQGKLINMFKSAALLSPIAHLNQIPSQLTKEAAQLHIAEELYSLGYRQFPPGWDVLGPILEKICNEPDTNCSELMTALTGELLKHEPQPTATKNIIHLSQMIRTGTIAMYDYGSEDENKEHYGQSDPPAYNMKNIPKELPLFLGYGGQDMLADANDVKALLNDLKDHDNGELVEVYSEEYAHADFVLGVNASQVVYDPMISFFDFHSS
ncbi:triacylglycerol lipase 2-like [Gossypium australe]|uniref:Lipase n=1 Tax=Gossypium australe TaxID=47621 RepID=A0A5B6W042_9ROSI|nr:triacylglycerol lipase 2-like [Gossypium australe]